MAAAAPGNSRALHAGHSCTGAGGRTGEMRFDEGAAGLAGAGVAGMEPFGSRVGASLEATAATG